MQRRPSDVLEDESYRMPEVGGGKSGLAWLRAHVVRFCDGPDHARRRALTIAHLDTIQGAPFDATPTRTLLHALGLPVGAEADVELVAAAYQPHAAQSEAADTAADRLIALCGGRTHQAAAALCLLVQAHAATNTLAQNLRDGTDGPPVPTTRRCGPDGVEVEVDLADAPFGRGPHRCPGEVLARRLAAEAILEQQSQIQGTRGAH